MAEVFALPNTSQLAARLEGEENLHSLGEGRLKASKNFAKYLEL